jgi:hypothetical protein
VAQYLTIPEVTDSEEIVSFGRGSSDRSFNVVINWGETANRLFQAANNGTQFSLVVLVVGDLMLALDDVYVSSVHTSGGENPLLAVTFDAAEVRVV